MKILKTALLGVLLIAIVAAAGIYLTGNSYILRAAQLIYLQGHVTANINDHVDFETSIIKTSQPSALPEHSDYNQVPLPIEFRKKLEKYGSVSFLVLKDGKVVSESYFGDYHDRSKTNSFSMAKTVLTLLLGIAIEDGHITSLDQPLTDFLPEFATDPMGNNATIGQLSAMNSGYEWVEHYYSPFSPTVELLYGADVEDFLLKGYFSAKPGTFFEYSSASTQLLGIVLKRALEKNQVASSLSDYLSKQLWQPMQMNDDALWHTDSTGLELAYCCLNTNARNYAKLGMLMLNLGKWQNQQLVPMDHIRKMITPLGASYYGYSTWLNPSANPAYYWFSGHLGQYIINVPEHNMVIVRLGEARNNEVDFRTNELPNYVTTALMLAGIEN